MFTLLFSFMSSCCTSCGERAVWHLGPAASSRDQPFYCDTCHRKVNNAFPSLVLDWRVVRSHDGAVGTGPLGPLNRNIPPTGYRGTEHFPDDAAIRTLTTGSFDASTLAAFKASVAADNMATTTPNVDWVDDGNTIDLDALRKSEPELFKD